VKKYPENKDATPVTENVAAIVEINKADDPITNLKVLLDLNSNAINFSLGFSIRSEEVLFF
jgi:hypothetical protein